jgi:hypothetical protein
MRYKKEFDRFEYGVLCKLPDHQEWTQEDYDAIYRVSVRSHGRLDPRWKQSGTPRLYISMHGTGDIRRNVNFEIDKFISSVRQLFESRNVIITVRIQEWYRVIYPTKSQKVDIAV